MYFGNHYVAELATLAIRVRSCFRDPIGAWYQAMHHNYYQFRYLAPPSRPHTTTTEAHAHAHSQAHCNQEQPPFFGKLDIHIKI